jgi:hypothetical protein
MTIASIHQYLDIDLSTKNTTNTSSYKRVSKGMYIINSNNDIFKILQEYHSYIPVIDRLLLTSNEDKLNEFIPDNEHQFPSILNISNVGPFSSYWLVKLISFNDMYKEIREFL